MKCRKTTWKTYKRLYSFLNNNNIICNLQFKYNFKTTALHDYQHKKKKNEPGKNDDEKKEKTQLSNRCTEIEDFSNVSINQETSMVSMCVVPVTVKHKNSSREVKTLAMLDNCSQGTFVKEDLLKKLKLVEEQLQYQSKPWMEKIPISHMQLMACKFAVPMLNLRKYGWIFHQ